MAIEIIHSNLEMNPTPCPFCKNKKKYDLVQIEDKFAVQCQNCKSTGPHMNSEQGSLWAFIRGIK